MPGGRPPKRRKFNFNKNEPPIPNLNESQDTETCYEAEIENTDLDLNNKTNLMTCNNTLQTSSTNNSGNTLQTSSNFLNYDLPSTSGVTFNNVVHTTICNQESNDTPATARPMRKAKVACRDRLMGVIMDLNDSQSQELEEKRIHRERDKKLNETAEERQQRLSDDLSRVTQRISQETCVQRSQRLSNMSERENKRRNEETPEERSQRLDIMRHRINQQRNAETPEERSQRLNDMRQRNSQQRNAETPEDRSQRLNAMRQRNSQQRNEETPDQRSQRLENLRMRANEIRAAETHVRREQRLQEQLRRNARRQRRLLANSLKPTYKLAVQSDVACHRLGEFNVACVHCGALHFPEERVGNRNNNSFGDCCLKGKIDIEHANFPNELARLFSHRHPLSPEFHQRIKNLNSSYAMASYSCDDDRTINNRGIYTYIANGQVYHKINAAAQPTQTTEGNFEKPLYGQMYFLDSEEAVTERGNHPQNDGISVPLFELLEEIIRSENPFSRGYMMMREVAEQAEREAALQQIPVPNVRLLFTCPEGLDPTRYNVPQSNEVCAVVTLNSDQSFPDNPLIIRQRGKSVQIMKNIDKHAEPLTYPLFFPKGTFGFSPGMLLREGYPSRGHITRLELARYRIAFRPHLTQCLSLDETIRGYDLRNLKFNALHFGGRLFQQYLVDTYIRIEYDRIQWIKLNQKKILANSYSSVTNYLNEMAQKNNAVLGEKIILPSSFPGSTRYYSEHFEDAMALVRRFGSPDFFITMTCNPDWPEIKEAIKIKNENGSDWQQLAQDRPDIIARVAYLKFAELIEDLDKSQIFGQVAAYVYTVEFQKRGLPHMHLLIILKPEDKIHNPEELDDLVSAEIPDVEDDSELRELVKKWMIHQACGEQNQKASCMVNKNGRMSCRFKFPMGFQDTTSLIDDGKPKYRRRYDPKLDQNNRDIFVHEEAIYRKDAQGQKITRDNRHVAPYNPYLLKKFNCHINVEYVGSIRAVKYLYKYIYKGHDCAALKVVQNQTTINYNEADKYIQGRCITPPEACWRLFGNEIQKKSHCVQRLDIHLPGQYRVQNIEQAQEDLLDIGRKGSMLEAYFRTNQAKKQRIENNDNTENSSFYFYWQMPEFYR